jgi:O-antigen ligase
MMLWAIWLLVPLIRRVLGLFGPVPTHDPLSVVPFLATILVAIQEVPRVRLDVRAQRVALLAGCGFAFGIPRGLSNLTALLFDGLAYVAALSGLVLGYADLKHRGGPATLWRMLLLLIPLVAIYGIYQYFNMLPWDRHWFETAPITSIGAPQKGHPRIWGTLNSPGTFAPLIALSVLALISASRVYAQRLLALIPLVVALALTFVRSAWAGLIVALLVLGFVSRGKAAVRLVGLVAIIVIAAVVAASASPTGQAVVSRFTTFGSLGSDTSAQARTRTPAEILPEAIRSPFGQGLGSAGLASGLGESTESGLKYPDNGYLSLIVQLGPIGAIFVLSSMIWVVAVASESLGHGMSQEDRGWRTGIFAMLIFLLVDQLGGEVLYGVSGVIFWYLGGCALACMAPASARAGVQRARNATHALAVD